MLKGKPNPCLVLRPTNLTLAVRARSHPCMNRQYRIKATNRRALCPGHVRSCHESTAFRTQLYSLRNPALRPPGCNLSSFLYCRPSGEGNNRRPAISVSAMAAKDKNDQSMGPAWSQLDQVMQRSFPPISSRPPRPSFSKSPPIPKYMQLA